MSQCLTSVPFNVLNVWTHKKGNEIRCPLSLVHVCALDMIRVRAGDTHAAESKTFDQQGRIVLRVIAINLMPALRLIMVDTGIRQLFDRLDQIFK